VVSHPWPSPSPEDFCLLVTMTSSARYALIVSNDPCNILTFGRSGILSVVRESVLCKVTTTVSAAWVSATMLFRFAQVLGTRW